MRVGILIREGAESRVLRHRVAQIHTEFTPLILALRAPTPSKKKKAAPVMPFHRRAWGKVWGKTRGLYANFNYPPRYYDLSGQVEKARERFLPETPLLSSYPDYKVVEVGKINSAETARIIQAEGLDVLLPYTGIIRKVLLEAAPWGCLNVHHGWLPEIRGMYSAFHAIAEDRPDWVGVTVHRMDEGIDTGPIFRRGRPVMSIHDNHEALYVRLDLLGAELLWETLRELRAGNGQTLGNPLTQGVYRSRPTFAQHLRVELRERRFFRSYGQAGCPPLSAQTLASV